MTAPPRQHDARHVGWRRVSRGRMTAFAYTLNSIETFIVEWGVDGNGVWRWGLYLRNSDTRATALIGKYSSRSAAQGAAAIYVRRASR